LLLKQLLYGRERCSEEEMVAAAKAANIFDLISSLPRGFDTQIGERGLKLSGGEKQRVAIARLILKNPSVVVLDEATSSLDTVTERSVHAALDVACRGRTTVIIAHRLSTVRAADEIVVLNKGRVLEAGSHERLVEQQGGTPQCYMTEERTVQWLTLCDFGPAKRTTACGRSSRTVGATPTRRATSRRQARATTAPSSEPSQSASAEHSLTHLPNQLSVRCLREVDGDRVPRVVQHAQ
jgi:ABC-type multidrug transport system ATPase subunit